MPSPIAHVAAGYAVYCLFSSISACAKAMPALAIFAACVFFSLLPDADSVVGVLAGDMGGFHNNLSHSLAAGLVVAIIFAALIRGAGVRDAGAWFLLSLACYVLHVVMDYFTAGRGVMMFWPFCDTRFQSPWPLFRGVQWAMGLWTIEHIWTVLNEMVFVGALALVLLLMRRTRHCGGTDNCLDH